MLKLQVNTDNSSPVSLYEFMWSAMLHNMHNTKRSFQTADQLKIKKQVINHGDFQNILNFIVF